MTINAPVLLLLLPLLLLGTNLAATAGATLTTINTTAAALRNLQCVESPAWVTPKFFPYDCFTAITHFEEYEVEFHSTTLYEFIAASLVPPSFHPPPFAQLTPRKYTYKSCTLAVVMLADFPVGELPVPGLEPVPGRQWARTDLGDYAVIWQGAVRVRDGCLSVVVRSEKDRVSGGSKRGGVGFVNPTGYDVTGANGAIGIFLWDTESAINQAVKVPGEVGEVVWRGNGTGRDGK